MKVKTFDKAKKLLKRYDFNSFELIFKSKDLIIFESSLRGYPKGIKQMSYKQLNEIKKIR